MFINRKQNTHVEYLIEKIPNNNKKKTKNLHKHVIESFCNRNYNY